MPEIIYDESIFNVLPYRFLDYSVAVLKDRAIPDGFDGLKPIHRRVLMAMHDLGLSSRTPHRKSAKTIGEVLGKYHPHGDQSAYEALVGLAQAFNMRYPLVDGSGNFGSLNGDPAAAMRYTESRLSPFGELMLEGVEKLSPTKDNFDNSAQEPITLSSYFPNLLLNPTNGIAVGLATKFAPHYARDVYDALIAAVQSEARGDIIDQEELISIIKAPDFPTGAEIVNGEEVKNIYRTGKGPVTLRAKYRLEKNNIVYYEIPYKVTPKSILEKIASLNLTDIKDVRDESSLKNGLRLVVELKKDTAPEYIVNKLFKETDLQCNYNVNMVAIMDNRPADKLTLGKLVGYYLNHLQGVHRRSLTIQKQELEGKLFVINTLLKAIDCIDAIIRIVRYDDNPVQSMQDKLGFTKEEAEYIFNIRLSSLSKANKLDLDAKKTLYAAELARLSELLENRLSFLADLVAKLESVRDSKIFKDDKRRTDILNVALQADVDPKQYVKQEDVIVSYSTLGFLRSNKPEEFKVTSRKTLGTTLKLREDEHLLQTLSLSTHDDLLLFSDLGKAYILPVYKIPIGSRKTGAKSVNNYLNLEDEEHIIMISYIPVNSEDLSVVFVTAQGWVKRTNIELLTKVRSSLGGSRAIGLEEGDRIAGGVICHHNADICIFTSNGRGLKFNIDDPERAVRPSGKTARGVLALRLQDGERVVAATTLKENSSVLIITSNGFGKRLSRKHIKDQKRAQVPIQYLAKTKEVGEIVSVIEVQGTDDIIITTRQGQLVRVSVDDFKAVGKTARGLMMLKFKAEEDAVVSMSSVVKEEETAAEEPEAEQQALF